MKSKVDLGARILLGVIFFVFGLNGFFHFMELPPMPQPAKDFLGALVSSGYFFPMLSAVQTIGGIFLLTGYYVPLGLVILAPVVVNILLFHIFLDPAGLALAIVVFVLELYLGLVAYRSAFGKILVGKECCCCKAESCDT